MKVMQEFSISGHIHDLEVVALWGHLPRSENVKFTSSGEHNSHHLVDGSPDLLFMKMKKWFTLLTKPVREVKDLKDAIAFLLDEDHESAVLINKVDAAEVRAREKFYRQTPDVAYAEIDFSNFDSTLSPQVEGQLASLGLSTDWWSQVVNEYPDPNQFFAICNSHAVNEANGSPDMYAFERPKGVVGGSSEAKVFWSMEALGRLLPSAVRSTYRVSILQPDTKYDMLIGVINALKTPLIMNTVDAERAFARRLPIYFIGVNNATEIIPYWRHLEDAASLLRGDATFMVANNDSEAAGASVSQRLLHHLNVLPDELPAVRLLLMQDRGVGIWEKSSLYCPSDNYLSSSQGLVDYYNDYQNGKLKLCVRSEPLHDDMHLPGEAEVLVGENFEDQVFLIDTHKDILIDAYAPWCGHCKAFEPQLRKLAEFAALIPGETLRVAKIDATRNDLTGIGQLRGYPSLLFFPGGNRKKPIEHRGSRSAEDLLKWIRDHATNKFDVAETIEERQRRKGGHAIMSRAAQVRAVLDEL
eukprot:GHVH01005083.1.p1 GENE.GHVH01005083.1~~GHVH01005083.1.p1  ORF type:complete len:527 (+),score=62.58 GHVH01005083.1:648-2228(+)